MKTEHILFALLSIWFIISWIKFFKTDFDFDKIPTFYSFGVFLSIFLPLLSAFGNLFYAIVELYEY